MTATIPAPRSSSSRPRKVNWEKWGWLYMRISGVLLLVLVFGHLFVNLVAGDGVHAIDFAFVAGKWADPFWVVWDTLMLWLALIHGANGMRTLTNDYARGRLRKVLLGAILVSTIVLILLGSLVIFTFDPCIGAAQGGDLAQFCAAKG
ncbi:succinate dehydrogenase [Schumannella luteola]|jgi:succinate dehydrogenase / fumarate reductase, membrane anchor subunit|uniref:Succinate dehydrogenase / fumarate reductase membrane anchor subunit n=1 Tax=Schumannella luteola TaxID=472059 RepID=A0A852Y9Z1_9MICO|nr:succinate dehydrogenase hydrophobic membrane anchor subunit [Schumannella luteola]NYG98682.1 succinate dehydrogenase / fumarate reductase membrane anchor subunit [Schumannella luteola]TPX04270.1 succinate dehydrogenase [Schumannella luteola]